MDYCNTKEKENCCSSLNNFSFLKKEGTPHSKEKKNMKGGKKKMNTRITLWVVIGALFVATLFLTFKAGAMGSSGGIGTVQAVTTAAKSTASASYGGMVGGC